MSFTSSRRSNARTLGTQRTSRYSISPLQTAQISEPDQERVSALAKTPPVETEPHPVPPAPLKSAHDPATTKAYTIVKQPPATARRPPNAPPKVVSHKELLNRAQGVQCYDAVPVNEPEDAQAEVEKFIPMLEEYLKRTLKAVSRVHAQSIYAVFLPLYPFSIGHSAHNVRRLVCKRLRLGHFLPPNLKVYGLEQDLSEYRNAVRVTLRVARYHELIRHLESTGLPASFGDPDESDPESEVEDEGDEDSNG
jgi:hypothetical protein